MKDVGVIAYKIISMHEFGLLILDKVQHQLVAPIAAGTKSSISFTHNAHRRCVAFAH
jgi:hypothetical protein